METLNKYINYNTINIGIIYFVIIAMILLYGSKYYPIVTNLEIIICFYILYYSNKIKYKNIVYFLKTKFFKWYSIFWGITIIITYFKTNSQLVGMVKSVIVTSLVIVIIGMLYYEPMVKKKINFLLINQITTVLASLWMLINEYDLLFKGDRIGFSINIGNPNSIGGILAIMSIINLYIFLKNKKGLNALIYFDSVLFSFLTGSKRAILIVMCGFLLLLFNNNKIDKKRLIITIVSILFFCILCFIVPILYDYIGIRFLELLGGLGIIDFQTDSSTTLRMTYSLIALSLWKNNIFFGGGFDVVRLYGGFNTYSHNNYFELLASFGLIGTLFYYSFYFYEIKLLFVQNNSYSKLIMVILIGILISDIGAVTFLLYPLNYLVLLMGNYILDSDS